MQRRSLIRAAGAAGLIAAPLWAPAATAAPLRSAEASPKPAEPTRPATAPGSAQATRTLRIGSNNTPLDRAALQALTAEALKRVGGWSLELVRLPSERSLRAANAGEIDGEGLRVAGLSAQYPQLIQVSEPYFKVEFVAFARQPALRLDSGWADLPALRVALITGWKLFEAHTQGVRSRTLVDTPEQLFQMLRSDRVDVALYTLRDGVALAQRMGLSDVHPVEPTLHTAPMYLYLHQRHADLAPRLAQALRAMKADGPHARLLAPFESLPSR